MSLYISAHGNSGYIIVIRNAPIYEYATYHDQRADSVVYDTIITGGSEGADVETQKIPIHSKECIAML